MTYVGVDPVLLTGPILFGTIVSFALFGMYLKQIEHYVMNQLCDSPKPRKDPIWLRVLICAVSVLELLSICMIIDTSWYILVLPSRRPGFEFTPPGFSAASPLLTALISFCVQSFFARRIWMLCPKARAVATLIELLSLVQLSAGAAITAMFTLNGYDFRASQAFKPTFGTYLGSNLACDCLITVTLVIVLLRHYRDQSTVSSTRRMLDMLSRNTMENGLMVTACVALELAFYLTRPGDLVYAAFQWVSGQIVANVILASINGRQKWSSQDVVILGADSSFRVPEISSEEESRSTPSNCGTMSVGAQGTRGRP
ncbi:hypothetical protein FA15DRAFT_757672 [Coprinopsis marcescibilis]|uniref:DUF6534 domain-containing protein n=1 Tax=Coprinopsis marcescibilis TaxID=230819 RepID=A0A5C3L3W8_COPMA|nr:hypothetical protein FA15DRAFT_757672 [Coprinopsis marcescibilis]